MRIKAKPGPIARARAAKARKDRTHAATIRALVAERDDYRCRLTSGCDGPVEWAHWGCYKRFKTRGQAPEQRHTTAGSLLLCRKHHADYDHGRLSITAFSERGCNGPLAFTEEP